jgi:hypothetical protein
MHWPGTSMLAASTAPAGPPTASARSARRGAASDLNPVEVRQLARKQGIEVTDRGRVPANLVVKFRAATS